MATGEPLSSPPEVSSGSYHHTPINHGVGETSSSFIRGHKLNGNNYLLLFIRGKSCDEYLTGELRPLPANDPNAYLWKIENNMVMSWLVTSMTPEIRENFFLYETAHEIWEATQEFYSSKENTSVIFEIESTLHNLR